MTTVETATSTAGVYVSADSKSPLVHEVEEKQLMKGDIIKMLAEPSTKGQNVSGRTWKVRAQKRASSIVKTKVNNGTKTWDQRQQERLARKEYLELQSELREERRQSKIVKKERRLENEKRRAENEFKNAQKSAKELNTGKLRTTLNTKSKKQLRKIKKTRMNNKTGVLEYVSAYAK